MSMISTDDQLRYSTKWFMEWSDLQRSDFLPIMAERYTQKAYVNGIVNSVANIQCNEKPMSLFECRVKLFKEWFTQWNPEQKESFATKVRELDPSFATKFNAELENGDGGPEQHEMNGEAILED